MILMMKDFFCVAGLLGERGKDFEQRNILALTVSIYSTALLFEQP